MSAPEFDHIVVGGGSAGCAAAARLAGRTGRTILLLEAGGSDRTFSIRVPGLLSEAIGDTRLNWRYRGEPDPTIGGRSITWSSGHVLGGGSSINGMVFGRGLAADFDAWAASGAAGWAWRDVLPVFRRMETWAGEPHAARGHAGPLSVVPLARPHELCRRFVAAASTSLPFVADYNIGITQGVGYTQASQIDGERCSASRAYLRPVPQGLTIAVDARATRLRIEAGACVGVEYRVGTALREARARVGVILSAGAVATPKLLMLSGIGPADQLRSTGIKPILDLPEIGRNLQEHVGVPITVATRIPSLNRDLAGWRRTVQGARWLLTRGGPAALPANEVQMFLKTDPALTQADVQIQMAALGFTSKDGVIAMTAEDAATFVVSLCRPESRGAVTLRSGDPMDKPCITYPMQGSGRDLDRLSLAIDRLNAILGDKALSTVFGSFVQPRGGVADRAGWHDFIRAASVPHFHLSGTCRMGTDRDSVVDPRLGLRGIAGLWVADTSILPLITSGNTNATAIMIGERVADFV
jgi:choline dehydrogenase